MRRASQAYRDRHRSRGRGPMSQRWWRGASPARFIVEGRRTPIHLLPPACCASMLVHGHRVGRLDVTGLNTYHAIGELGRQMQQFRKRVLLRLHPDKLAGANEEDRRGAEQAFKEISLKLNQGVWFPTSELRTPHKYQGWIAQLRPQSIMATREESPWKPMWRTSTHPAVGIESNSMP